LFFSGLDSTGWAVGDNSAFFHSQDSGATWDSVEVDNASGALALRDVDFFGPTRGIAVGDGGRLLKMDLTTGVWTGTNAITGRTESLQGIDLGTNGGEEFGLIVGDRGLVLRTENGLGENGGEIWQEAVSGTDMTLWDVRFVGDSSAWAAGQGGTLLRTTDRGQTWTNARIDESRTLYALDFDSGGDLGLAVGDFGTVWITQDGGESWGEIDVGTTENIRDVEFISSNSAVAVTDQGRVIVSLNVENNDWNHLQTGQLNSFFSVAQVQDGLIVGGWDGRAFIIPRSSYLEPAR
jgi:photosystem II stability/assembly factor-like uncharacterized protein